MEKHSIAKKTDDFMDRPPAIEGVEELSLLLPSWQIMALAEAAEVEGLTVAQFMRRLINAALDHATISG